MDGTMYQQSPLRMTMGMLLLLLNLHRPLELCRVLKVISAYRQAQESLRKNKEKIFSPANKQLQLTVDSTGESLQIVKSIIEKWFERFPLKLLGLFKRRQLVSVLDALSAAGIKLGVYSDYPATSKLQALGVSQYFTVALSAADEKVIGFKPRSNGFELAATLLDLLPENILYVGDRPEIDGVGAAAAGMQVVIISGRIISRNGKYPYQTIKSLKDLLVIVSSKP